jgi:DNA-binding response OmpR family regulator
MRPEADADSVAGDERPTDTPLDPSKAVKLGDISPTLIVEDNYLAAAQLARLMEEWDIPTRSVGRAAAARELARDMRPKLALVDINLEAGFEGIELARELQALYGTKIVFVTAYHVRDLMHRLTGAENMAVLFKPVEPDVLLAVLEQCSALAAFRQ